METSIAVPSDPDPASLLSVHPKNRYFLVGRAFHGNPVALRYAAEDGVMGALLNRLPRFARNDNKTKIVIARSASDVAIYLVFSVFIVL